MTAQFPVARLRRLRRTPALRRLVGQPAAAPEKLIWPVFVETGHGVHDPIDAMPGQARMSSDVLVETLDPLVDAGLGGVLLFGLPPEESKGPLGRSAGAADGVVPRAIGTLKEHFGNRLAIAADVCLCAYTTHGHCGPLRADGTVDNDAANDLLAETAVVYAAAGADIVAPSAMMDGQVAAIRTALDTRGATDAVVMSYSTKFASSFYGPFREAERSAPQSGDRRGYQADYTDPRAALRESELDEAEGADILMVKPALPYLDIIARLRDQTRLPIAAYNVSGEYAMIHATADRGWGERAAMAHESLAAVQRAGADIIITYWANALLQPNGVDGT